MLPMYFHQFTRFLLKLGFRDEFIVKRMFETFDVDHNDQLNFVEVLGLLYNVQTELAEAHSSHTNLWARIRPA